MKNETKTDDKNDGMYVGHLFDAQQLLSSS